MYWRLYSGDDQAAEADVQVFRPGREKEIYKKVIDLLQGVCVIHLHVPSWPAWILVPWTTIRCMPFSER